MPYIDPELRKKLDPLIEPLRDLAPDLPKGCINYIITRIVSRKYATGGYLNRSEGANVFMDARDEFYRRVVAPYEDKKCEENGDVYDI